MAARHARRRRRAAAGAARGAERDNGFRAHNTNVYPQRPDRCYLGYLDAGMIILDIADKASRADLPLGQLAALSRLHPHGAAAVRAQPARRHRRVGADAPRTGRS